MLTEQALLERIDFNVEGLEKARAMMERGRQNEAVNAVISHFQERKKPCYLFDESEIDRTSNPEIIAEADEICAHKLLGIQLGETIDWRKNATADTTRDPEWMWSLARQIFWPPLARAYAMTGDEAYALEFVRQMKDFILAWPVEEFLGKIGQYGEHTDMKYPANAWRTIEAAIRVYAVWLPMLTFFRNSTSFDREAWVLFLNALCDHGDFLMEHYSCHSKCSNWDTMESTALFSLGVMLPEFSASAQWKKTGFRRAMNDVRYQFDHSGVHIERTPIYHLTAAGAFLQVYRLAQKNRIETPPYMLPILEKAAEFLTKLIKPDLSTPMVGDADRNSLQTLRSDVSVYEGMNNTTDPSDENELRAYFRVMAELTGRQDFQFFATAGAEGSPPEELCAALPDAGYYVFRSGWSAQASYFAVTGTILERGENSVHSHYDAGHLELQIEGKDVLIDTGRYLYNSESQFDWRIYFSSTAAHNTIQVDDHIMGEHPDVIPTARGVRLYCQRFEPGKEFDLLEVSHNGYAYMNDPVFHRRRIIWLKPDIWVVEDRLTGLGVHRCRQYWNFAPGELSRIDGQPQAYCFRSGALSVEIQSIGGGETKQRILYGSSAPIGGWVSYGYALKEPAPQLICEQNGPIPMGFVTVLSKSGAVTRLNWSAAESGGTLCVETAQGNWSVRLSEPECTVVAPKEVKIHG